MDEKSFTEKERVLARRVSRYETAKESAAAGDWQAAYEALLQAVTPTEPEEQYEWACAYFYGYGVRQDYKSAFEWLWKAYQNGSISSACMIAWMYFNGMYVEKDLEQAYRYFLIAAEAGDAQSQRNLGAMLIEGLGVAQNTSLGLEWVEKAAGHFDEQAQVWIGQEYYRGRLVPVSYNKAHSFLWWFDINKVSNTEIKDDKKDLYIPANCLLGMMYLHGKGIRRDYQKALKCLRYAAENGDNEAQFWLGFQYVRGLGVDIDIDEGDKWLKKSAESGFDEAVKLQQSDRKREFLDALWEKVRAEAEAQ